MSPITIFSILTSLPIIYPLYLMFMKKDLNLWDILILFSCLFFSILPAIYGHLLELETDVLVNVSFVIFFFHFTLLLVDMVFRKHHGKEFRILNISFFLRHIQRVNISFIGKLLIALGLAFAYIFYLPRMSIAVRMEESGMKTNYAVSSFAMAMTSVISIIGVVLTLATLTNLKHIKNDKILIALDIVYFVLMLFMPRRMFVFPFLEFAIVFYSIHKKKITKKLVSSVLLIFVVIYFVYFPFYNVIRWNKVNFSPSHPIESLVAIVKYGMNNFSVQQTEAIQSTDERTLGLYEALYNLFNNCTEWGNGKLTIAAIDGAIPRILNPNKGKGTEYILEQMTGTYTDQADSIPLEACGDFGSFGAFYAVFLFLVLFWLYEKYSYLYYKLFKSYLVPTFIMFEILSITWNIEGNFGGRISFFFSSIFSIIVLLLLEHHKIITITRRRFITITKVVKKTEENTDIKQ